MHPPEAVADPFVNVGERDEPSKTCASGGQTIATGSTGAVVAGAVVVGAAVVVVAAAVVEAVVAAAVVDVVGGNVRGTTKSFLTVGG